MMRDINTPYITDPKQIELLEQSMHGKLEYTLMNDFLAKYTLQNDVYALKGLLAALLDLKIDKITAIEILNPVELHEAIDDKKCILDLKLELNREAIINIEIQTTYQDYWADRSLTYLCRNFDHLKEGQGYQEIKPCIQIGILEKDVFRQEDPRYTGEFYSRYQMLHVEKHTEYSGKFEVRVLLLNHLEEVPEEKKTKNGGLYHWAKLFLAQSWEELKMIADKDPMMRSFIGTVRKLTADEKVAMACEARRRYSNDMASFELEKSQMEQEKSQMEQEKVEIQQKRLAVEQKEKEADQKVKKEEQKRKEEEQRRKEAEKKLVEMERKMKEKERMIEELYKKLEKE